MGHRTEETEQLDDHHFDEAVNHALAQLNGIEGSGEWPLSERLTAFFFLLLDVVEEEANTINADAPAQAFRREGSGWFSPFQESLRAALPAVGRSTDVHGVNRWWAELAPNRTVVAEIMVQMLQSSLEDESEDRQRSAALADRVLTVLASVWSTPVPAQVVDVLRYSIEAGYLPIDKWPVVSNWLAGESGASSENDDES